MTMFFSVAPFFILGLFGRFRRKEDATTREVEQLYQTYGYLLRRRCKRILNDDSWVEDAMQEILITMCRSLPQYRGEKDKILAWLYRITTTHCLQLLDKNKRWARNFMETCLQQLDTSSSLPLEEKISVEDFLNQLPGEEKEAAIYYFVNEMSQEEIAEVMQVNRDRVRVWLKHFKQRGSVLLNRA